MFSPTHVQESNSAKADKKAPFLKGENKLHEVKEKYPG